MTILPSYNTNVVIVNEARRVEQARKTSGLAFREDFFAETGFPLGQEAGGAYGSLVGGFEAR
jgi:hypothetical protein